MKLFKSISSITTALKLKTKPPVDVDSIKKRLQDDFYQLLEKNYSERELDTLNSNLGQDQTDALIRSYTNKNLLISTAASVIPGPLGVLSAIPQMVLIMSNQMKMIYDLGCAYDKEEFFNKDILLDIPIMAFGGQTNLNLIQDAENLLDSPVEKLKDKSLDLGTAMVKQNLKKSMVTFIPVGGTVIMNIWTKMATKKIATKSQAFFDPNQTLAPPLSANPALEKDIEREKLKVLINLIESDGNIGENQIDFILPVIQNCSLSNQNKELLVKEAQQLDSNFEINYSILNKDESEIDTLLMDMSILAKRDHYIHPAEKSYILEVCDKTAGDKELALDLLQLDD